MKCYHWVLLFCLCVFSVVRSEVMTAIEEEMLATDINLDEFDFEEMCAQSVPYAWSRVVQKGYDPEEAFQTAETYAEGQREKAAKFLPRLKDNSPTREPETTRKLEVISKPGYVLLPTDKYRELLSFSDEVQGAIAKKHEDCNSLTTSCDLTSHNPDQLLETWSRQSIVGTDAIRKKYPDILDLVSNAAEANGFPDVESYWLMLSDLDPDGYTQAKKLWDEVEPLYKKLHFLVATKVQKKYGKTVLQDTNKQIPLHLLGSYLGNDWSNIADIVLSSACVNTFHNIEKAMEEKQLKGKQLYQRAEILTGYLHLGKLPKQFWEDSNFNQSCPAKTINPCRSGVRVAACSNAGWSNYLDAHRIVMESAYTELNAISSISFLLKSGNRYSAIYDAVSGLAEVLASSRHYMAQHGLVTPSDKCALQTVLTLTALRVLPSLPYYLVADLARLQAINTNNTSDIGAIWQKLQSEMQGIATPGQEWWGFLNDLQVTSNQPLIDKFYGVFLQFQLFEEIMTNNEESFTDAEEFIHKKEEFKTLLLSGISKKWPELLEDVFKFRRITSAPLLTFFSRFESTLSSVPSKVSTNDLKDTGKIPTTVATTDNITNALVADVEENDHTMFSNDQETETVTGKSDVSEGFGLSSYLLIAFLVIMVVIMVLIVLVKVVWKKTQKSYEPPTHQNEPA